MWHGRHVEKEGWKLPCVRVRAHVCVWRYVVYSLRHYFCHLVENRNKALVLWMPHLIRKSVMMILHFSMKYGLWSFSTTPLNYRCSDGILPQTRETRNVYKTLGDVNLLESSCLEHKENDGRTLKWTFKN